MDLATPFNSLRKKTFDKEDLETSVFDALKKRFAIPNSHCEHWKSGVCFTCLPHWTGELPPKAGSGHLLFTHQQSWDFWVTEPCLRWKLPEILNHVWKLQNLSPVTKQMKLLTNWVLHSWLLRGLILVHKSRYETLRSQDKTLRSIMWSLLD